MNFTLNAGGNKNCFLLNARTAFFLASNVLLLVMLVLAPAASAETIAPATAAAATVDFFEGDDIEASIHVESVLLGEQGNGIAIGFGEASLGATSPNVFTLGNPIDGFSILFNADDTSGVIPYSDIVEAIDSIAEISASLYLPINGEFYEFELQAPPPVAILSGGTDAIVPEPCAIALANMLGFLIGCERCRKSMSAGSL